MKSEIFRIVFEDESLLVIEKLKPFLSQKSDRSISGEGLFEFVSRSIGTKLYPVHRLDREVLGLMIFGKTREAAENLSEQFKSRNVEKGYEAVVSGRLSKDSEELVHFLKKNPRSNYVTVFPKPTEGAKRAELKYHVLDRSGSTTRLFVSLKTGRSHQIRAQLSKIGHPIVGDQRYRKHVRQKEDELTDGLEDKIQLRSVLIGIRHPLTKERMRWNLLPDCEKFL